MFKSDKLTRAARLKRVINSGLLGGLADQDLSLLKSVPVFAAAYPLGGIGIAAGRGKFA